MLAVLGVIPAWAGDEAGAEPVTFQDFFRRPVGPRGLEPTARLLQLDGQRVAIEGYVVREHRPVAGRLILSPVPVELGDEDEGLSDDLPASALFIHSPTPSVQPPRSGRMRVAGVLHATPRTEADGRTANVWLALDPPPAGTPGCAQLSSPKDTPPCRP